jgi:hypothetical protein
MTGSGPRLAPLPPEHSPALGDQFASFIKTLGFVPNSVLTMRRKPALLKAFVQMRPPSGARTARSTAASSG